MSKKSGLGILAIGTAIGAGLGVVFAPKKGSETRSDLKKKKDELINKVKNLNSKDIKKEFNKKIKELERELATIDKEKIAKKAKEQAKNIKNKAEELVKLAKEKGNSALEETANALRNKAIEVTKSVLEKLENTNQK